MNIQIDTASITDAHPVKLMYTVLLTIMLMGHLCYANPQKQFDIGKSQFLESNYTAAITALTDYITLAQNQVTPGDSLEAAYVYRGISFYKTNSFKWAITDYTNAMKLNPANYTALFNRAAAHVETEYFSQAIRDFTAVLNHTPKHRDALKFRAGARTKMKEYKKALMDYTEILSFDPQNSEIYYLRGMLYILYFNNFNNGLSDLTIAEELGDARAETAISRAKSLQNGTKEP